MVDQVLVPVGAVLEERFKIVREISDAITLRTNIQDVYRKDAAKKRAELQRSENSERRCDLTQAGAVNHRQAEPE